MRKKCTGHKFPQTKRFSQRLITFITAAAALTCPAFAVQDEANWGGTWNSVYQIAKSIGIAAAVLAVAYGGILMLGLSFLSAKDQEKRMSQGKQIIVIALTGLVALLLLPYVVNAAAGIFAGIAWQP